MTLQTGISEDIEILDNGSTDITDLFGVNTLASHNVEQETTPVPSIGQGTKPVATTDGVATIQGSITCQPSDLRVLQVFGSFTDNGDGTYTVTFDEKLPAHTFKQEKVDGNGTAELQGFKFGSMTLSVEEDGVLTLDASGLGNDFEFDESASVDTASPNLGPREFFQTSLSIDGTSVGSVESVEINMERELSSEKGIEDDAQGEKRTPTAILETAFNLDMVAVVNIENQRAWEEALGDTSSPYEPVDNRAPVPATLTVETPNGTDTVTLSGFLPEEVSSEMANDGEKRTATLAGTLQDITVDGDLP